MILVKRFVAWARSSLFGHVTLCQLIGTVPISGMYLGLSYSDGTLTLESALWTVLLVILCMAWVGLILWFTITLRLARIRSGRKVR